MKNEDFDEKLFSALPLAVVEVILHIPIHLPILKLTLQTKQVPPDPASIQRPSPSQPAPVAPVYYHPLQPPSPQPAAPQPPKAIKLQPTAFSLWFMSKEILLAVPVTQLLSKDGLDEVEAAASSKRLVRNRRNISWYKQHSDFWNWYKYFTDNGNQEGVAELDRVYLAYLQNKNRAEAQRSYKLYLQHLSDIYKSCAESDDPNCVASYTSRSKPKAEPPKPAPVKNCDPFRDPYCRYALGYSQYPYLAPASVKTAVPVKAPAPAPVTTPAYIRTPAVKDPRSGYYYYSSLMQPFLSAEQKSELMRICDAEDVECLQYHLRAAYGYKPATGAHPSYAHLGCDPKSDPNCISQQMQKTPASLYLRYPQCDPRDPYCAYAAALASAQNTEAPSPPAPLERPCNPLYEENCNPLTAIKFASLASSSEEPKDEPAPVASAIRAPPSPHFNPLAMYQDAPPAAVMRRGPPASRQPRIQFQPPSMEENRHPLGPPGKTKEGYDCFIGYDKECYPIRAQSERPAPDPHRQVYRSPEAYEPHLNADGTRNGVIEPDPDCDPEYDSNCRLRRYEPESKEPRDPIPQDERHDYQPVQENSEEPVHHEEVPHYREDHYQHPDNPGYDQQQYDSYMSGQEDPYASYGTQEPGPIRFQDVLRGYGGRFSGDYRKK
ncbi:actinodin1 [Hoplias malabaricus]|uniref:actinodin1 n=1 Tax=Hoplias malabaricus TaxID=27720 RepID=UPI0034624BA7